MRLPRFRPARLPVRIPSFSADFRQALAVVPRGAGVVGLILPAFLAGMAGAAEGPRAQVVSEGAGGFTLRITLAEPRTREVWIEGVRYLSVQIPGFAPGSDAAPGSPDLPLHGFPFGLPEGVTARIARVHVLASTSFQGAPPVPAPERKVTPGDLIPGQEYTFRPDPQVYASRGTLPGESVTLGPVQGFRHQRIQSLVLRPVQVVPATGNYEAIREVEVEIRFDAEAGKPGRGPRRAVRVDAPGWDETMDRLLVNPESARSFRSRPVSLPLSSPVAPGDTYVRVRLGGTGFCRIPFASLLPAGWPSGVPVAEVRVEERGYDKNLANPFKLTKIPRRVEDTNQNGIFDGGDYLLFYGFNYQDRFNPSIADSRYSYFHTYWITPSGGAGADLVTVDGYPAGTGYVAVSSFPETDLLEQNLAYINNPKDSGSSIFPIYDTVYWLRSDQKIVDIAVPVTDLAPGANFRVRARWQGVNTGATGTHIVSLDLNSQVLLAESPATTFFDLYPLLYEGTPRPAAGILFDGSNTVTVKARTADPVITFSGCLFDWFEITYDRLLIARNDQLRFDTGAATDTLLEFAVTGFSAPDVLVLDVTDPDSSFALSPLVENAGESYTAKIRVAVNGTKRIFHAMVPGSVTGLPPSPHPLPPDLGSAAIARGLPRDLLQEGQGSDYILITHPAFRPAWQPLADYRDSQGHRVFLCDVWEIYDQFAGGDKTPWAIQRFLLQAFRQWDPAPSMVLLGGDASEDYRTDTDRADPDWVPTLMHFAAVPGANGLELSGTDTWYAAFLREGDRENDVMPEMHVARVPAGTTVEVADYVQKVLDYESWNPGDDWRRRGMFLADDQYSSGILATGSYCYVDGERVFKLTSRAMIDSIRVEAGLTDFRSDSLFMSDYLDTVAVLNRHPGVVPDCPATLVQTRNYARSKITPALLDSLSRGYLLFEFTGHANKNTLTHEGILDQRASSPRDVDRMHNFARPFLFMGYACHLMEFEGYRENEVGQSFGEEMLLAPNRGAVGVMASTAFEWLHTNPLAQIYTTRPLFWNLPRDPSGRPRRLWGEAMTRGMVALITENPRGDVLPMIQTYQTFGDPALRVDISQSLWSNVAVDSVSWTSGGELTAKAFTDTLTVDATVNDDVDVSSIRILENGVALPGPLVTVTPPSPSREGTQPYQVRFRTPLRLGTYDISMEAQDWAGRPSSYLFPVRLLTRFFVSDSLELRDGDTVEPNEPVGISLTSPVPLAAENLQVWADGTQLIGVTPQGGPNVWRMDVRGGVWSGGSHTVEVRVSHSDAGCVPGPCPLVRGVAFTTPGEEQKLLVEDSYFYPNPVEAAQGQYLYRLTRSAVGAQVNIYSVSGRRVRVLREDTPLRPGLNAITWDLRDEAGDEVSNGVYLLMLRVNGDDGNVVTPAISPERVVVTR